MDILVTRGALTAKLRFMTLPKVSLIRQRSKSLEAYKDSLETTHLVYYPCDSTKRTSKPADDIATEVRLHVTEDTFCQEEGRLLRV